MFPVYKFLTIQIKYNERHKYSCLPLYMNIYNSIIKHICKMSDLDKGKREKDCSKKGVNVKREEKPDNLTIIQPNVKEYVSQSPSRQRPITTKEGVPATIEESEKILSIKFLPPMLEKDLLRLFYLILSGSSTSLLAFLSLTITNTIPLLIGIPIILALFSLTISSLYLILELKFNK